MFWPTKLGAPYAKAEGSSCRGGLYVKRNIGARVDQEIGFYRSPPHHRGGRRPSAFGRWRGRVDVGIDPYALGARKIPATSRRRRQMVPQQKSRANPAPRVTTSL